MSDPVLFGDFETRSTIDLPKCGADVYARHATTDMMCFGYAFDDEPAKLIEYGDELPHRVRQYIANGGTFIAHNAPFELLIWNHVCRRYGWPALSPKQVVCTMAMAYAMNLPGALEKAAPAIGLQIQKDMVGHRTMLQLSRPRDIDETTGAVTWWDPVEFRAKYQKMHAYCLTDIEVERALYHRLLMLSPLEQKVWQLDRVINERGVRVDVRAVETAIAIVEEEKKRLNLEMRKVTGNQVSTYNATRQLTDWLKFKGVPIKGVAKNDVLDALSDDGLDPDCRKALRLRQEGAKASTAKLSAMSKGHIDGRIRGMFQYHGAGQTGRWAGRRIQLHNLPRSRISQRQIADVFRILDEVVT